MAVFTLLALVLRIEELFENNRLVGTVGYYNGEAAFLLIPFWVSVYLASSDRINWLVRRHSSRWSRYKHRGCCSNPVPRGDGSDGGFTTRLFLVSLVRGCAGSASALAPIAAALFITFPELNRVYLEFLQEGSPAGAIEEATPVVWLTAAGAGLYGSLWGLIDRWWKPGATTTRFAGIVALASVVVVLFVGSFTFAERVGSPVAWGQDKWEAFKTNDKSGQEKSRYLSASGTGRFTLWKVAWEDFESNPVLGVGTYNYEATYYQLRDRRAGYSRWPHTLQLEVLAERGRGRRAYCSLDF